MTNDAMTKAEARAYELAVQAANDWRAGLVQFFAFDSALIAYGDARAAGGRDAMTKSDASRERLVGLIGPGWPPYWEVLQQYGDARAVEAEIAALRAVVDAVDRNLDAVSVAITIGTNAVAALADAEQRERAMP